MYLIIKRNIRKGSFSMLSAPRTEFRNYNFYFEFTSAHLHTFNVSLHGKTPTVFLQVLLSKSLRFKVLSLLMFFFLFF